MSHLNGEMNPHAQHHPVTARDATDARFSQVVRTSALDQLMRATEYSLTVVSAPVGYGKTALLTEAIAALHLPTARLTLDERDNDPLHFWARVATVLRHTTQDPTERAQLPTRGRKYHSANDFFAALIAALPAIASPVMLVLDDYHRISPDNRDLHEALATLVRRLPSTMHLIVASRTRLPLPLAALRTDHRLLELDATDLRFTLADTRALLRRLFTLDLSDQEIAALHARTEGWVAALRFAAVSLREQADPHQWIAALSDENSHIFDTLFEDVVQRLPSHLHAFMRKIAVLDPLSAALCDAVTKSNTGQAMLEEMERANLFLVPLDDRREWYHLHQLFADVLRRSLRQTQPRRVPELYARASRWCESQGLALDSIDYALAANESVAERTAQLTEAYIPTALARGEIALLRDRLERLPGKLVRERPRLALAHAYTLFLTGKPILMQRRIGEAEQAITRSQHLFAEAELTIFRAEILALRSSVRTMSGESTPHARIASLRLAEAALPRNHEFRTFATLFIGINQLLDDDARAANQTLDKLMHASENHANGFYFGYALLYRGLALLLLGHIDDTLDLCARAAERLAGRGDEVLEAHLDLLRGKALYERGEFQLALGHLQHAASLHHDSATTLSEAFPALARAHLALGNTTAAEQTMERGVTAWEVSLAQHRTVGSWTGRHIRAHQAHLWLSLGEVRAAAAWAREARRPYDTTRNDEPPPYILEWEEIVRARLFLAEHRADDALALLDTLGEAAEAGERTTRLLRILVLKALAYDSVDDTPGALAALQRAVELGRPQRFVSIFVEGGPTLKRLLTLMQTAQAPRGRSAESRGSGRPHTEVALQHYMRRLISAFPLVERAESPRYTTQPAGSSASQSSAKLPLPALTRRQLEVLRLIASGASNLDIAQKLVITPSTAKRHASNIFAAMHVHRRTQAVAQARGLGILDADGPNETEANLTDT